MAKKRVVEESAWFPSRITFNWFTPMIIKGFRNKLTIDDMYELKNKHKSLNVMEKFDKNWAKQTEGEVNILKPILKTFGAELALASFVVTIWGLGIFVNPIIMDQLITFINSDEPSWLGYLFACTMFTSSTIAAIAYWNYEYIGSQVGMKIRACVVSAVYQKALRLSAAGRHQFATGEIVNLIAVDMQKIMEFVQWWNTLWISVVQVIFAGFLLWKQVGVASLAGIGLLVAFAPLAYAFSEVMKNLQVNVMLEKDKRIKLFNELLNGIKVLKLFAWERSFQEKVMDHRNKEVRWFKMQAYCSSALSIIFMNSSFWVSTVTFAVYLFMDPNNQLDANKAFVSLTIFIMIRDPTTYLALHITTAAVALVSVKRINKFLNSEEIDEKAVTRDQELQSAIKIKEASFSWSKKGLPMLHNVNLDVSKGKLLAVVGPVGCGKSSLLAAILGDMHRVGGQVSVNGKFAYVPQQPWILTSTLQQNILFVKDMDEKRYRHVLSCCALEADLRTLSAGDQTEIGEKGINLSGGQKARVSLARAVYQDADVYLLDDPLSAVDAHVEKHLFDNVIGPNGLLKNKTRILVTHRISGLPQVDEIIVIKDGKIYERGTYEKLINKTEFVNLINESSEYDDENRNNEKVERKFSDMLEDDDEEEDKKNDGKLIENEEMALGKIKISTYWKYLKTAKWLLLLGFSCYVITNLFQVFYTLWLSDWSKDAEKRQTSTENKMFSYFKTEETVNNGTNSEVWSKGSRLLIFCLFGIGETIFNVIAGLNVNLAGVFAAKSLHNKMFLRVIRGPMSFFDTTPIGRILNRFSKDVDTADTLLNYNLRLCILTGVRVIYALIMISVAHWIVPVIILLLIVIYSLIQNIYLRTSRQLKRLDAITRSPVYNHISETVNGVTSIRAYEVGQRFLDKSNSLVDNNHKCYFGAFVANRWMEIRLEVFSSVIVFVTALFAVVFRDSLTPELAAMAISYSLQVINSLNWYVHGFTELENNFVSAERCLEYTKTPVEDDWHRPENQPQEQWPGRGKIKFVNYSTRYREGLDLVLNGISLEAQPKQKVGVVGRTGAGKSSMTLALFRLIEPVDGSIVIDEVDIKKLGLHDLRSKLTIIPQDPALFTGSLRFNLDPFNCYSDADLWGVLELAHLKTFVQSLDKELEYPITEGGDNLSVGQKQLVCLARALLRKSKILVLDEATAAVDNETDALIQETIRKQFVDCTILTIAHRLNTIIDYDKILVMDKGRVAEFDSPQALLADSQSIFHSMAKEAGFL